jgi:hypothetical protein
VTGFEDPRTTRIAAFLDEIGIPVEPAELPDDTFLPGISLQSGCLRVDERHLTWPGDLLHEAGHVAVAPPDARERIGGAIDLPSLDMTKLERAAIAWSYAAALHIGLDPAEVFHEGGYHGKSAGLIRTYAVGVYPGANLLEEAGITIANKDKAAAAGVAPYPAMIRWLR